MRQLHRQLLLVLLLGWRIRWTPRNVCPLLRNSPSVLLLHFLSVSAWLMRVHACSGCFCPAVSSNDCACCGCNPNCSCGECKCDGEVTAACTLHSPRRGRSFAAAAVDVPFYEPPLCAL